MDLGPAGDYTSLKIDRVADPTPGKTNPGLKCQTPKERGFARALTLSVQHPAGRSECSTVESAGYTASRKKFGMLCVRESGDAL